MEARTCWLHRKRHGGTGGGCCISNCSQIQPSHPWEAARVIAITPILQLRDLRSVGAQMTHVNRLSKAQTPESSSSDKCQVQRCLDSPVSCWTLALGLLWEVMHHPLSGATVNHVLPIPTSPHQCSPPSGQNTVQSPSTKYPDPLAFC